MEKFTSIIRYTLIFIFLTTFLDKILDYSSFKHQLFLSPLIPYSYIEVIGVSTIVFEAMILFCLIINKLTVYGLFLSSFLLSTFGFYLLFLVISFKFNKPCGCGFIFSFLSYNQHITLNFLLSIASALILIFNENFHPRLKYTSL